MIRQIVEKQIQEAFNLYQRFKQWNNTILSSVTEQNTSTCCELMEQTASIQHELFRLLHHFVHQGGLTIQNQQPNLKCGFSGSDTNYPTKLQRPDSAAHYPQVSRTQSFISCPSPEINRPYSNYGHETPLYNVNATYPSNQLSVKPEKDLLDM
ncbi:hypothetical protein AHF37_10459 [Paragonimus kellicotti]|nr:hypothetical protein AHF37_10459 [Paragonimus kellicotti]